MKVMIFSKASFEGDILAGVKTSTMRPRHGYVPRYQPGEVVSARTLYEDGDEEMLNVENDARFDAWGDD